MRVITALSIFGFMALAYAALQTEPPVPPTNPPPRCSQDGDLIPNVDNCTTYYICAYGEPVLMNCPANLHFSAKVLACEWPELACCDPAYDPENKCNKTV